MDNKKKKKKEQARLHLQQLGFQTACQHNKVQQGMQVQKTLKSKLIAMLFFLLLGLLFFSLYSAQMMYET